MRMIWADLLAAVALCIVIEGIVPFLNPAGMKRRMKTMIELGDRELRIIGFVSMLLGLGLLYWVRS